MMAMTAIPWITAEVGASSPTAATAVLVFAPGTCVRVFVYGRSLRRRSGIVAPRDVGRQPNHGSLRLREYTAMG